MNRAFQPWEFVIVAVAGWINLHQQAVIDYMMEENRVFKAQLRGKRLRLTDDERRRLAVKGKLLGRRILARLASHTKRGASSAHARLAARGYAVKRPLPLQWPSSRGAHSERHDPRRRRRGAGVVVAERRGLGE